MLLTLVVTALPAQGQGFNINIGTNTAPASTYGAGSGQTGVWNAFLNLPAAAVPLVDLGGNATGVTMTFSSLRNGFNFNNAGTTGDDEILMDNVIDTGTLSVVFSGLTPGDYSIFTYAWAPDNAAFRTNVAVPGAVEGTQVIGGIWPGAQTQGTTFALHSLSLVGGDVTVDLSVNSSFGTLNGFQIVPAAVPEPTIVASIALVTGGSLGWRWHRRRNARIADQRRGRWMPSSL